MRWPAVLLLVLACAAAAQEDLSKTPFSCYSSSDPVGPFIPDTGLTFEPITDPGRIEKIRALPSISLAGFAASFQVASLRVFAAVSLPKDGFSHMEAARVTLYLVLDRNDGPHYFEFLPEEYDFTADDQLDLSNLQLVPATWDSTRPLVVLSVSSVSSGAQVTFTSTLLHLIDLSGLLPRSVARMDCESLEAIGECPERSVDDLRYHTELACEWSDARQDVVCTQRTRTRWEWGATTFKSMFYGRSKERIWPPEVDANGPKDLKSWVSTLPRGADITGRHTVLPGIGDTFALKRLRSSGALLLASRGSTSSLVPKFYVMGGEGGRVQELAVQTLEPVPGHSARQTKGPGILTGPPMRFTVKRLKATSTRVMFYQVLLAQEESHSLFWVAIDLRDTRRSQALLIATDAPHSVGMCPYASITASAARTTWTGRPPRLASLDVEPTRYFNTYGQVNYAATELPSGYYVPEGEINRCSYDVAVRWSTSRGWVLDRKPRPCNRNDVRVRAISISDTGSIRSYPVFREKPHASLTGATVKRREAEEQLRELE